MADSVVTIGADLGELRRELAKLPNLSTEAATKVLSNVERAVQKAEKAAKRSSAAISKANRAAAVEASKASKEAQDGLKGVYELAGGSGDRIEKLSKVWAALSNPVVASTVAVVALGAAAVGAVAGMMAAVDAAERLNKELEPLNDLEGFGIPPEDLASIQAANSSMEALSKIAAQAVVVLGAEFAPAIEKVGLELVKLGLMALDAWTAFMEGEDLLHALAVWLTDKMVKAFLSPVEALMTLIGLMGDLATVVGADALGESLSGLQDRWDGWTKSVATSAVDFYFDAAADSLDELGDSTATYDERAKELIGTLTEQRTATKALTTSTEDDTKALEAARKEAERLAAERLKLSGQLMALVDRETKHRRSAIEVIQAEEAEALEALRENYVQRATLAGDDASAQLTIYLQTLEARQALEEEFSKRRIELTEEESAAKMELAQSEWSTYLQLGSQAISALMSLSDLVLENQVGNLEEGTDAHKAAAVRQFRIQKGLALALSIVQQAQAALASIASLGPPVPPNIKGIVGMAVAATSGVASMAAIAASKPPTFHTGGMIGAGGMPAPDERFAKVRVGEAVLNATAASMLGESGVNALNRGDGQGTTITVVQQYRHRVLDAVVQDAVRMPGSSLRAAIKGGTRSGHRAR